MYNLEKLSREELKEAIVDCEEEISLLEFDVEELEDRIYTLQGELCDLKTEMENKNV